MRHDLIAVYVLTAFFGLQVVLAASSFISGRAFFTYQPPYWRTLLMYGGGGAYVAYLCWRRSPRARFAAYIFLTVDVIRAVRGHHWWTLIIDLALIAIMQMRAFRQVYPSIRPGDLRGRRARHPIPRPGAGSPRRSDAPHEGHGPISC